MCIRLDPVNTHVSKNSKKKSKLYVLKIDTAFDQCVKNIQQYTFTNKKKKNDNWISEPYVAALKGINGLSKEKGFGIKVHSVELWTKDGKHLAAAEIGYSCGAVYTSLSGLKKHFLKKIFGLLARCEFLAKLGL